MPLKLTAGKPLAIVALAAIVLLTIAVYLPGLKGPFIFDDQPNITLNQDVAITDLSAASLRQAALSNESGPLKRPLPALTFGLNHYMAGGFANTVPYKGTNLAIHLVNAMLVYWLSHLLLQQLRRRGAIAPTGLFAWLPALIAAAWALHPLQLTSVLYVVQRVTSLSALFVLAGLITFMHGRLRTEQGQRHGYLLMTVGIVVGTVLGLASKENAVLLPLFVLAIEIACFEQPLRNSVIRGKLGGYYAIVIGIPFAAALVWFAFHPDIIQRTYVSRDFGPVERLLTEARVLWSYVGLIVLPRIGAFGIFHDDIPISAGLLTPWTTLPALLGVIAMAILAFAARRRYALFSFAVFWFLIGHSMESSLIGLEIAHEHRNYLPSFGVLMGAIYGLSFAIEKLLQLRAAVILLLCYVAVFGFTTYSRAHTWASEDRIIETAAKNHPNSARSQYMLAEVFARKRGDPIAALNHYKRAAELDPHDSHPLIKLLIIASDTTIRGAPDKPDNMQGDELPFVEGLPTFVSLGKVDGRLSLVVSEAVMKEIRRRLREEPVRPHTSFTLGLLSACVNHGARSCRHLYQQAAAWYELALSNSNANDLARSYLASGLAGLYLGHGDHAKALSAATQARQYDPSNAAHWLMEAEVYLYLNRREQAASIIDQTIARYGPLEGETHEKAEALLAILNSKRKDGQ
jgi:protein O-mannosyl-transferase